MPLKPSGKTSELLPAMARPWGKCVHGEGKYFEGVHPDVSFTVVIFRFKHPPYFLGTPPR